MELNLKLTHELPEEIIEALGIDEDTVFSAYFSNGKIVIETVTESDLFSYAEKIAESSEGEFESADEVILYYGEDELKEEYLMSLITEHYTKE